MAGDQDAEKEYTLETKRVPERVLQGSCNLSQVILYINISSV